MLFLFKPPENKGFSTKKGVSDLTLPLKVAGLKTCNSDMDASVSIRNLRKARDIYRDIDHINIVKPIKYEETDRYALLLCSIC